MAYKKALIILPKPFVRSPVPSAVELRMEQEELKQVQRCCVRPTEPRRENRSNQDHTNGEHRQRNGIRPGHRDRMIVLILLRHTIKIYILNCIQIIVESNDRIEYSDDHQPDVPCLNACREDNHLRDETTERRHSCER